MEEKALELPDQRLKEKIWNEIGLNRQKIVEAVDILNQWLEQQPHLPRDKDDDRLERWLVRCKNSIEKTKQMLDLYYTLKTMSPEIMADWDTRSEWFHTIFKIIYFFPVHKLTPDGDRVSIMVFTGETNKFDFVDLGKLALMSLDLRACEDYWRSDIIVCDLSKVTVQHVSKITFTIIKKLEVIVMRGYKLRLKSAHLLNVPSYAQIVVKMVKSVLKPKLAARIHVHGSDFTEMYKYIPRHILPSEFGGEGGTIDENSARWKSKLESYREWFVEHEKLKSDEIKRPGEIPNSGEIFGFDGSFRKLDLD